LGLDPYLLYEQHKGHTERKHLGEYAPLAEKSRGRSRPQWGSSLGFSPATVASAAGLIVTVALLGKASTSSSKSSLASRRAITRVVLNELNFDVEQPPHEILQP